MSSYGSTVTVQASTQQRSNGHAKLHKRSGSGSSLPGPPSPLVHSQFTTPFATYEEPFPDLSATPPTMGSTPKIKPYIRKMSSAKQEDQGRLDLSKSTMENDRLAGLGIQDFGVRSAQDVSFAHTARRGAHARTTSVGSQASTASGSYKPNQPFVHPMRQTPRPFTPPTGSSNTSFVDEANESDDVIDDDYRLGPGFRSKRSISISSVPAIAPTPLSQSHTAEDLGYIPKLTNTSQTNLSLKSTRSAKSGKSGKSRLTGRPRRDTSRSFDHPTSPSSRTSFDKAFSFVSRKSDPEPQQTRDERIREARRKFEEREKLKDRKQEKEALKRRETDESRSFRKQERQRRKSEASERARVTKSGRPPVPFPSSAATNPDSNTISSAKKCRIDRRHDDSQKEKYRAHSYDETRPANLPRQGREAGMSEKVPARERKLHSPQSGWVRFSAWLQTRMLGCGGGGGERRR